MKNQIRFTQSAAKKSGGEESRIRQFIISDATTDRHGTVLDIAGWDLTNYNNNGIVGYMHDVYGSFFGDVDPDKVIGKGRAFVEGEKLIGEVEFEPAEINELAEKILKKVDFGTLKTTSVGFLPMEEGETKKIKDANGKENKVFHYGKRELLEWSIVNIPSNPNALKRTFEIEKSFIPKEESCLPKDAISSLAEIPSENPI